jgi:hypothetical protein
MNGGCFGLTAQGLSLGFSAMMTNRSHSSLMKNFFAFHKELRRVSVLLLSVLLLSHTAARAETPDDQFIRVYSIVSGADALATSGKTDPAIARYREAQALLQNLRKTQPTWNAKVVQTRLKYVSEQISALTQPKAEETTSISSANSESKTASRSGSRAEALPSGMQIKIVEPGAEPRQTLRFHPVADEKQQGTVTVKMSMGMGIESQMQTTKMPPINVSVAVTPTSVNKDGIAYEMVIEEIGIADDPGAMQEMVKAMRESIQKVKGLKIDVVMTDRGVVRKTEAKIPAGTDAETKSSMEEMRQSLAEADIIFPEEPIGLGAQWQVKQKVKSDGITIDQTSTYTLNALEGDKVTISGAVVQTAANQKAPNPIMPQVKIDLNKLTGSETSTTTLDMAKLFPSKAESDEHKEMIMSSQNGNQKQVLTIKMDTSTRFESK